MIDTEKQRIARMLACLPARIENSRSGIHCLAGHGRIPFNRVSQLVDLVNLKFIHLAIKTPQARPHLSDLSAATRIFFSAGRADVRAAAVGEDR